MSGMHVLFAQSYLYICLAAETGDTYGQHLELQ